MLFFFSLLRAEDPAVQIKLKQEFDQSFLAKHVLSDDQYERWEDALKSMESKTPSQYTQLDKDVRAEISAHIKATRQ